MVKMAAAKTCLPLKMPISKCCNSGTNNDIELKFGEFSYLMDMFMCTKIEPKSEKVPQFESVLLNIVQASDFQIIIS